MRKRRRRSPRPSQSQPFSTLAAYIRGSGESQVSLAKRTRTSQATISRIAVGDEVPRPELRIRLVSATGVPADSFDRVYLAKRARGAA
jgi:transcriptional regulator with XRE-family HTH domain